ncbi:MAG: hypothetical protein V3S14_10635 [Anaerolineae bacterium]
MGIPPAIAAIAPDGRLTPAQKRRFMIDFCLRRIRPGTGSAPEFLQRRTAMNPWPDLRPILQGIPWVIAGDVATRAYMPERATKDLDILVRQRDGDEVWERLKAAGYHYVTHRDSIRTPLCSGSLATRSTVPQRLSRPTSGVQNIHSASCSVWDTV